jgi:signal transduction histidine kinase
LLLLLQLDTGAVSIEIERFSKPVDMKMIVNDAAQRMSLKAQKRQVQIEIRIGDKLPVHGVLSYLVDIVTRLIDNAIKFSRPEGSPVLITGSKEDKDNTVRVAVADKGVGISPGKQKRLFRRFEQIDRETMEQQGTGLGLVIAMNLAQQHGGTIEVESEESAGSTFTLILPAI